MMSALQTFLKRYWEFLLSLMVMIPAPLIRITAYIYYQYTRADSWAKKHPTPIVLWSIFLILGVGVLFALRSRDIENNWWQGFSQNFSATALTTVLLVFLLVRFLWEEDLDLEPVGDSRRTTAKNRPNADSSVLQLALWGLVFLLLIIIVKPIQYLYQFVSKILHLFRGGEQVEGRSRGLVARIFVAPKKTQLVFLVMFGVSAITVAASFFFPVLQELSFELLGTSITFLLVDYFLEEQSNRHAKMVIARRAIINLNAARKGMEEKVRAVKEPAEPSAERDELRAEDYAAIRQAFDSLREAGMFNNATLQYLNLRGAYMPGIDISGIDYLDDLDLEGATLSRVDFTGKSMRRVRLVGADLREAKLNEAVLWRGELTGAVIQGADLTGAVLARAFLRERDFRDALRGPSLFAAGAGLAALMRDNASEEPSGGLLGLLTQAAKVAGVAGALTLAYDRLASRDLKNMSFVQYDANTIWPDGTKYIFEPGGFSDIEKRYTEEDGFFGLAGRSLGEGVRYMLERAAKKETFAAYFDENFAPLLARQHEVIRLRGIAFGEILFSRYWLLPVLILGLSAVLAFFALGVGAVRQPITVALFALVAVGLVVTLIYGLRRLTPWWIRRNSMAARNRLAGNVTDVIVSRIREKAETDLSPFEKFVVQHPQSFTSVLLLDESELVGPASYPKWFSGTERTLVEFKEFKAYYATFQAAEKLDSKSTLQQATKVEDIFDSVPKRAFNGLMIALRFLVVGAIVLLFLVSFVWQISIWITILTVPILIVLAGEIAHFVRIAKGSQAVLHRKR